MTNGTYKTEKTQAITGPALIKYIYRETGEERIRAKFEQPNDTLSGVTVEVERGLFVPGGAKLAIQGGAAIVSYVVPSTPQPFPEK